MAPTARYNCPCYKCRSQKLLTKRTIQAHCKSNLDYLDHLRASGTFPSILAHVQECYYQTTELLSSVTEESQSSRQSTSPFPDSEYFAFDLLTIYWSLI